MSQVPDLNQVSLTQSQGLAPNDNADQSGYLAPDEQKEALSNRLREVRGQAGAGGASSELKSFIEFLEGILGQKAPDGDDYQKIEFLTNKIKERSPQEQIGILKELNSGFSSKEGSNLDATVKALKKDVISTLKESAKQDKNIASTLVDNKNSLGQISLDRQTSATDLISGDNKFIDTQDSGIQGIAKKPFEKSLGFMQNFADHQQGFFEESAFKISEFAGTSDKSKAAYRLMREADNFWEGEKGFLSELKGAGKSRDNEAQLHSALRDLFTLELQMGSRFDADFANVEKGSSGKSDRTDLSSAISEKKSEIRSLHSNLA